MRAIMSDRRIPGWVFPAVGVVIVVALVAIGLNRQPVPLDPTTPEGTVQAYIEAVVAQDFETAAAFWDLDQGCIPDSTDPGVDTTSASASLVSVETSGDTATVQVTINESSEDALQGVSEYNEFFQLNHGPDGWKIQQPSWPYYFLTCTDVT
jgi:hypothetical protein